MRAADRPSVVTGPTEPGPEPIAMPEPIAIPRGDAQAVSLQQQRLLQRMFGVSTALPRVRHYELVTEVGRGGMGVVYEARDVELDRKVAIKQMHAKLGGPAMQARFMREAQALAKLSHPNIVQIFEVGREDGVVFLAMEFVAGRMLAAWARAGQRSWRELLTMLIQAGHGLAAAHAAMLVHRDFKPENVLVGDDGRARVVDFGLVRSVQSEADLDVAGQVEDSIQHDTAAPTSDTMPSGELGITSRGAIMGTPAYMAPEQHLALPCGPLADQYAFCVVAFELLGSEPPFAGRSLSALLDAKRRGPRSHALDPSVPGRIRDALRRGLAFQPNERWPDMPTLLRELERGLGQAHRRRRIALGVGVVSLVALAGIALGSSLPSLESLCATSDAALVDEWNAATRERVREAFARASPSHGADAAQRVITVLDAEVEAWRAEQRDVCEATHVRHTHDETQLAARTPGRPARPRHRPRHGGDRAVRRCGSARCPPASWTTPSDAHTSAGPGSPTC